jgi:hypothetical protein
MRQQKDGASRSGVRRSLRHRTKRIHEHKSRFEALDLVCYAGKQDIAFVFHHLVVQIDDTDRIQLAGEPLPIATVEIKGLPGHRTPKLPSV